MELSHIELVMGKSTTQRHWCSFNCDLSIAFHSFFIKSLIKSREIAYSQEKSSGPEIFLLLPQKSFLQIRGVSDQLKEKMGCIKSLQGCVREPMGNRGNEAFQALEP